MNNMTCAVQEIDAITNIQMQQKINEKLTSYADSRPI